jgi:hypothetical protein
MREFHTGPRTRARRVASAFVVALSVAASAASFTTASAAAAPVITDLNPNNVDTDGDDYVIGTATGVDGAITKVTVDGVDTGPIDDFGDGSFGFLTPPHAAGTTQVQVTDGGGNVSSNNGTADDLIYVFTAAPTITGVSPKSGPVAGGTVVTLTGTGFTTAVGVIVTGGDDDDNSAFIDKPGITIISDTQLSFAVPAHPAGVVDIGVANAVKLSKLTAADQFTYGAVAPAAPTLTSVTPNHGPIAGGNTVTLTGTNLTGATAVKFGSAAATDVTVVSATSVTAKAPSGAAGPTTVSVTTPGGTSGTQPYTYDTPATPAPAITSISPTHGAAAGGNTVTITGTNLTGVSAVKFGTASATAVSVASATSVTAKAPAGAAGTTVNVSASNAVGTSNTVTYSYDTPATPAPAITGINPTSGDAAGGNTVTITGTNLTGVTAVKFGSASATSVSVVSGTSVTAKAPAGSGKVDVTVTNSIGTSNAVSYTYVVPAPTVTGLAPTHGALAGGNTVTITGTNLSGATGVKFGAVSATNLSASSPTSLSVTAPAGAASGKVDVTVTTPGGTSANTAADDYAYDTAPPLSPITSSLTPTHGPAEGGTVVTITGANLTGTTAVKFGAVAATGVTTVSATQVKATAPAGAAGSTVPVTVTTPGGSASNLSYSYDTPVVPAPVITSVVKTSTGNYTITGTGFIAPLSVKFGAVTATANVLSATQIKASVPAFQGTVIVTVTTAVATSNGVSVTEAPPTPTITGISPTHGPAAGGTKVTITGTNLADVTGVKFGSASATGVSASANSVTATAPAGTAGSSVTVSVTAPSGTLAGLSYAYDQIVVPAAKIDQVVPQTDGSLLLIGSGFTGTTSVKFGTVSATTFTVVSDTQIKVTPPALTGGQSVNITVASPGGASNAFPYTPPTVPKKPAVSNLAPAAGPTAGGTVVTITGTDLSGTTAVTFGGKPATSVTNVSATQVKATAPAGAAGKVDVVVTTAVGSSANTSADDYTYSAPSTGNAPTVTKLAPKVGLAYFGGVTTISGANFKNVKSVRFGTRAAVKFAVVGKSIVAIAPPQKKGVYQVTVTTSAGTSATSTASRFTYVGF